MKIAASIDEAAPQPTVDAAPEAHLRACTPGRGQPGVRPSPGTARCAHGPASKNSIASHKPGSAAPEDGRTPVTTVSRCAESRPFLLLAVGVWVAFWTGFAGGAETDGAASERILQQELKQQQ